MTKQYIDLLTEHEVKLLCLRERVSSDSSGFSPFSTKKQSVHYRILRSYKDTLHVITQHYRFFEICFKKTSYDSKKNLMHRTHLSFDSSVVSETAPSSRSVTT